VYSKGKLQLVNQLVLSADMKIRICVRQLACLYNELIKLIIVGQQLLLEELRA